MALRLERLHCSWYSCAETLSAYSCVLSADRNASRSSVSPHSACNVRMLTSWLHCEHTLTRVSSHCLLSSLNSLD